MTKSLWSNRKNLLGVLAVLTFLVSFAGMGRAQTTAFNYQGSLKDGGTAANGAFQMQFKLFDSLSGVGQIGSTITDVPVTVTQGVFSVSLDFGSNALGGANRWLEIAVRHNSSESYVTLAPRNQIASSPYSVRTLSAASADGLSSNCIACVQDANINSLSGAKVTGTVSNASNATTAATATNATQLGGVAAAQYVVTTDPRMTDSRSPAAGSSNYIQNGTSAQSSSNFNITGTGTAGILNAGIAFNSGGSRILSSPGNSNLFAGINAGANMSGGNNNAFFGGSAGQNNTNGGLNAFFGQNAGAANLTGNDNAIFGMSAGASNTTGSDNALFGFVAGSSNTTGSNNTFFGRSAGDANQTGSRNTIIGSQADVATAALTNASAIGSNAQVSQSNSLILGSINTINGATADTNVGIGTTAPSERLHVVGNGLFTGNMTVNGSFTGSGSGLSGLNASNLSSGTLTDSRLSSNVALLNTVQTFSGSKSFAAQTIFNSNVGVGTASPARLLHVFAGSAGIVIPDVSAPFVVEGSSNTFLNVLSPDNAEKGILFGGPVSQFDGSIRYNNIGTSRGFQFRTFGNLTRMTITSAGDVGIGTTTPAAKLDVQGNVSINGTITVPTTARYYGIAAAAFIPDPGARLVFATPPNSTRLTENASGLLHGTASFTLPDGATITELRALVGGGGGGNTVTVSLIRQSQTAVAPASSLVASVDTSVSTGVVSTTTITNQVVDNNGFAYYVIVSWTNPNAHVADFYGVRIAYTITSPLP